MGCYSFDVKNYCRSYDLFFSPQFTPSNEFNEKSLFALKGGLGGFLKLDEGEARNHCSYY